MRELARQFPTELALVGIHSGKFVAERTTARIGAAAARLGVHHPVVNDRQFRAWRAWAARGWPTVAVVDPRGYVAGMHVGEITADALAPVVARLRDAHPGARRDAPAGASAASGSEAPPGAPSTTRLALRFPGKVAVSPPAADGARRLAVSDTGHHRVLVGTLAPDGRALRVERVIGRGVPTSAEHRARAGDGRDALAEAADGAADAATFDAPQGLAFAGGTLWVADAGNHAVRAVDLATGAVRTAAGTGVRVRTRADRDAGALASPWDVAAVGDTVFVAMAGTHQLWALDARTGRARAHAGGRGEAIVDGPLADALLAQPMGIDAGPDGRLWFVDAESSAVRGADSAADGAVRTVVGTGLFDFGDRDGEGDEARLQHPQGLAVHPSGRLLVADSYNDALKWVDPATRRATTWLRDLHEPGGVACADGRVWIADTNAHRVLVADERTGEVGELGIVS